VEQRKTRRFTLRLPVALTRAGDFRLADAGFTKNISSCGVLLTVPRELDVGGPIEYVITLSDESRNPVTLKCTGKVVRQMRMKAQAEDANRRVTIAATMDRYRFVRSRED
jgi:hypothetical protein